MGEKSNMKRKRPDYKGFVLHIREWNKVGVVYGIDDLIQLAERYNTPIPRDIDKKKE